MKDKLKEFVEDYNAGKISMIDLERRLQFEEWRSEKRSKKECLFGNMTEETMSIMSDGYDCYMRLPKNPADIVEQKEISIERYKSIAKLKTLLKKEDWKTLVLVIKGRSQQSIAKIQGITQSAVCKHLKRIAKVANSIGMRELLDDVQVYHNQSKSGNEFSSAVDVAMAHKIGKRRVCMVPEYLKETGCESICLMCSRCAAKDRKIG